MEIIDILHSNDRYLEDYIKLCHLEWGQNLGEENIRKYVKEKKEKILSGDKEISILALLQAGEMIGFISLFKYDGDERKDLTPWYATMYVKKEYRNRGYSKILNDAIIKEARRLGYSKIYLKSELKNYYEKFGAKYMDKLQNGENLYYIDL